MHKRITVKTNAPNIDEASRKKRVAAYSRVSSERDEAFHSLSAQVSYYHKIIDDHPDWEFVEVFSDRGISGTKDDRPGFQAMLAACREGKIDIVLAKSITRFARNTVILLETVRELKDLGVDIRFEEERINTLSATGELMISLLAARAQEEARSASENQKWRIKKKYEQGIPVSGNCLGYRLVDGKFLIEEDEEQTVLKIFSMYLSGMGCVAIAKKLRSEQVPTITGNTNWSCSGVHNILVNEKYCGDLCLQKKLRKDYLSKKTINNHGERPKYYVSDSHDAIIPRDTFEKVQTEICVRKAGRPIDTHKKYPFTGMITCGYCGKHFKRTQSNSGTPYIKKSWSCASSSTWGKSACPSSKSIPERILIEKTSEVLGVPEFSEAMLHEFIASIDVPENHVLIYHFRDGTSKRVEWKFRSRSESWTPEKREQARQRALAQGKAKDHRKEKT